MSQFFAPQTRQQVRALMQYISKNEREIEQRQQDSAYCQAVSTVRDIMREYYRENPPQKIVRICPWTKLGTLVMCEEIAEKYSVPVWRVISSANPYM